MLGVVGLLVAAAAGTFLAVRKVPSSNTIRAALDRHGSLGGLLMTAGDMDIGRWDREIACVPTPTLRWQPGRQSMLFFCSVAFLIAAFLAPDRYLPSGNETALQIGGEIEKLTEKIQVLKQEHILPPEKAQVLEKDLDRIRQEALGKDPAKTMETFDHLEQSLGKAAADAAESAIKQTEMASQTQQLAKALEGAQAQMDPKQFREAMKELAHLAEQSAAESESLADSFSEELAEACRQGDLTDQQLAELCEALGQCKACQRARLVKLIEARLIDGTKLLLCEEAGECDEAALVDALCQCDSDEELAAVLACRGLPGRGGITRGRADAVMTWQQDVNKGDAAFKEQVLPPAAVASLKQSRLVGVSVGDPTSAKPTGGSSGGALDLARAGGGEARTQIILPKHEKTVQRYFNREKK